MRGVSIMFSLKWGMKLFAQIIASGLLIMGLSVSFFVSSAMASEHKMGFYQQTNLVSDIAGKAKVTDANLQNPWGIVAGPKTPFWIADNASGVSTLYNGDGQPQFPPKPLVVTIPPPKGASGPAAPTGIVFNDTGDFVVSSDRKSTRLNSSHSQIS